MTRLPNNFFTYSQFGHSPALPPREDEPLVTSDLNLTRFTQLGFPAAFTQQLERGIPLLMHTIPPPAHIGNYSSVKDHRAFVKDTLQQWDTMGVYKQTEHKPHMVHPLGVVEKEGKQRLILDATATQLNKHLYAPKFQLPSHARILPTLTHRMYLAKADLKSGFLQLPIRERERTFVGFKHPITGKWCVFHRLPFGLGPATFLFQTFTVALKLCLRTVLNIDAEVYIDDWLFFHLMENMTATQLKQFECLCDYLGIIVNHKKSEGPAQALNFLGLRMDLLSCKLQLPEEKRQRYRANILRLTLADNPSMDLLAQVAGQIVHIASVHRHGWSHTQPLWDVLYAEDTMWTKKALKRASFTQSSELIECLIWWAKALASPIERKIWIASNNSLLLWEQSTAVTIPDRPLTITTDASSTGWGASCGTHTLDGIWTKHQAALSNNWRETRAVLHAIHTWSFVRQCRVLVLTDNSTTMAVINQRRPSAPGLLRLADQLSASEATRKIEIVALHLPGKLNGLSDALSRQMPILRMTGLTIDRQALPTMIRHTLIQWGLSETTPSLPRLTPCPPPTAEFLIALSTPDIPFLQKHLLRWQQAQITQQGWILIPALPSDHCPIPNTTLCSIIMSLMPDVPQISFLLLQWSSQDNKH